MNLWYRCWQVIFGTFFRVYLRGRVVGVNRLPQGVPVVVAVNHLSFLDPPLVGALCRDSVYYFARKSLFRNPLAAWLFRSWHVVPVDRERGDVAGLKTILRLLEEKKAVLMFPEGTRSADGQLQPAQQGFGWLVVKSGAVVLPVRIWGTEKAMPRGVAIPRPKPVTICFGEVMRFDELIAQGRAGKGTGGKAIYDQIGGAVMARLAQLTPCND